MKVIRSRKLLVGCCPVHGGDNPTAFNITVEGDYQGIWHCNTHNCHFKYGNDLVGLLSALEKSYPKGIEVARKLVSGESYSPSFSLYQAFDKLTETDEELPTLTSREYVVKSLQIPSPYYLGRNFSPEILTRFDVGDCVDSSKPMYGRAVFPIYKDDGVSCVGSVGRSIDGRMPKWINSAKTGSLLYGLWLAKQSILDTNSVRVLEGQGDVIRMHEAGHTNSVGMFTKQLTDHQIRLLVKLGAMNLIVYPDNDEGGRKGLKSILEKCSKLFNVVVKKTTTKDIGEMSPQEIQNLP